MVKNCTQQKEINECLIDKQANIAAMLLSEIDKMEICVEKDFEDVKTLKFHVRQDWSRFGDDLGILKERFEINLAWAGGIAAVDLKSARLGMMTGEDFSLQAQKVSQSFFNFLERS